MQIGAWGGFQSRPRHHHTREVFMTLWVDMVVNCIGGGLPYIGLFSCIELENVLNEHWSIIVYAFAST